jgi:glucose-6-phosphate dehydrogenase assembly protein OpcA
MPLTAETYFLGYPVEVENIGAQLKQLWEQGGETLTRASLVNMAVYSDAPDSLARNTQLMSEITQDYACRGIVIAANSRAPKNHVEAWVNAHCHVSRAGSKQICSEQLSFLLEGPCTAMLPSIVFSHLDSDLPFYLWWQGEFHDPMDPQLWAWVDRLIYDSQTWSDFQTQFRLVESAEREARQRVVLCDLNWTRLDKIRLALAQFFDHPAAHHHFAKIERAEIEFAPQFRSTALLLAGWLAAQLDWRTEARREAQTLTFIDSAQRKIDFVLRERGNQPIGKVRLLTGDVEFYISHAEGADLLEVSRGNPGEPRGHQLMPAGSNDLVRLVSDELMRGGPHSVYLRAVNRVRDLL